MDNRFNPSIFSRVLQFIGYLIFSVGFGITITVVVSNVENIVQEKELKRTIETDIRNAVLTFKSLDTNVEDTLLFLKNYVNYVMKDKVAAVDTRSGKPVDDKDLMFLFSFNEDDKRIDIFIKKSYIKKTANAIDPPDLIVGFIVAIITLLSITIYSERKRQMVEMRERHKTETSELVKALQEHEALALLGRMTATLAHEFRTPISTISNLIQVLPYRLADEHFTRRFIALTKEELNRTQQLIDNLLVYGKEITIKNEEWIPCKDFIESLSGDIGLKKISCQAFKLYGDRFYVRLLFENLLRNSLQAAADHVYIEANKLSSGNNPLVEITFEDNGTGFPHNADLKEIINPFVTSRPKGAGLGLYLVYKIVSAHNGTASLYRLNHGAGIRLTLPAKRVSLNA